MNQVTLLGHLTNDVELRYLPSGQAVAKFNIATNKKGKDGKEKAMFIECSAFGGGAEVIANYFRRGSRILIQGELEFQQWQNQNGAKQSKHIVIVQNFFFIDKKGENQNEKVAPAQKQAMHAQNQNVSDMKNLIANDDLPF